MDSTPSGWLIKIKEIIQFAKYCTKFLIRNVNVNWMNVILDSIPKKSFKTLETWNEWWCLVYKKRWNFGNFWWKCASIAIKSHVYMNALADAVSFSARTRCSKLWIESITHFEKSSLCDYEWSGEKSILYVNRIAYLSKRTNLMYFNHDMFVCYAIHFLLLYLFILFNFV